MANTNGAAKQLVAEWSKSQKEAEAAAQALKAAQAKTTQFARGIYEALGTAPFTVKSLGGRKYRAIYKQERTHKVTGKLIPEQWVIMPIAENEAENDF